MKKVLFLLGTRPEVIKLAPVIFAAKKNPHLKTIVCATSQHRTMQDQMLEIFGIKPDYDLAVMKPNQDLFYLTAAILQAVQTVLLQEKPDMVVVQGDTTTVMAGALAAFYAQIPVAHVEAGLRTHDLLAPFPEEANRQLAGRLTTLHFAPTHIAAENLKNEGIAASAIYVTGNTVIDALFWMLQHLDSKKVTATVPRAVVEIVQAQKPFILVTGHRRESFGDDFEEICRAIKEIAVKHPDFHIIYPVHLNPNVQRPVFNILAGIPNVQLIEPVTYDTFVWLLHACYLVLTDSGGVQEEAPSLGKPVLVMRQVTERPEGIAAGTALLVGTDFNKIVGTVSELIENKTSYEKFAHCENPYGNGTAAQQIIQVIASFLSKNATA